MTERKGKLFIISAPSGAGKTTLAERAVKTLPRLKRSISLTTRVPRNGEKSGCDYVFVDTAEFKDKIRQGKMLEYARVFGNYYGTPRDGVEKDLKNNFDVLLCIDVQGAMKIRKKFKQDAIFIFIIPPSLKDLRERLGKRKANSRAEIEERLAVARHELTYLKNYDYGVVNDDLESAFKKLCSIITAERCKVKGRK